MQGSNILDRVIGSKLEAGILQSFHLKGKLVERINVTYLKFGYWIKIVSSDEITNVKIEADNIEQIKSYGDDEFQYQIEPIQNHFPYFLKYIGKELLEYKELVLKKNDTLSFGINLYFEGNMNFIIHNQDYPIDKNEYLFENIIPNDLFERNQ
jgi:hypothetical protein